MKFCREILILILITLSKGYNSQTLETELTTPLTTEAIKCQSCSCGFPTIIEHIVGGVETQEIHLDWMAKLLYNNQLYCGGSFIADRFVLAPAHCLSGFSTSALSVSLLVHDRTTNIFREINIKAEKVYVHEGYNPYSKDNDIGIIHLAERVEISNDLRTVCMPQPNETFEGKTGIASCWGEISNGGLWAQKLMRVPIITNEECNEEYGDNRITENMLCAAVPEGNTNSCQGNSGGLLHVYNEELKIYRLAGIISWGKGNTNSNWPNVYTRVNRYLDWIENKTKDGCSCDVPST